MNKKLIAKVENVEKELQEVKEQNSQIQSMIKELISCIKLRKFDDLSSIIKPEVPKYTIEPNQITISPEPLKSVSAILEVMNNVNMKSFIYHYVDMEVALVWSKASSDTFINKKL